MGTSKAHDLTDTWHGRFTYPRGYEPASFTAELRHIGASLTGTVEEPGIEAATGLILTSTISGKVAGDAVTFCKTYDVGAIGYAEAVHYVGAIRDEGLEIAGTWTIPGAWSGDFIMIRSRGLSLVTSQKQTERV